MTIRQMKTKDPAVDGMTTASAINVKPGVEETKAKKIPTLRLTEVDSVEFNRIGSRHYGYFFAEMEYGELHVRATLRREELEGFARRKFTLSRGLHNDMDYELTGEWSVEDGKLLLGKSCRIEGYLRRIRGRCFPGEEKMKFEAPFYRGTGRFGWGVGFNPAMGEEVGEWGSKWKTKLEKEVQELVEGWATLVNDPRLVEEARALEVGKVREDEKAGKTAFTISNVKFGQKEEKRKVSMEIAGKSREGSLLEMGVSLCAAQDGTKRLANIKARHDGARLNPSIKSVCVEWSVSDKVYFGRSFDVSVCYQTRWKGKPVAMLECEVEVNRETGDFKWKRFHGRLPDEEILEGSVFEVGKDVIKWRSSPRLPKLMKREGERVSKYAEGLAKRKEVGWVPELRWLVDELEKALAADERVGRGVRWLELPAKLE